MAIKEKKRFTPSVGTFNTNDVEFEKLLDTLSYGSTVEGNVVKGTVVGLENEIVIVDVGLKNEGRIPVSEFTMKAGAEAPTVGDIVDVYVEKAESRHGNTILSREKAVREESWELLAQSYEKGENVEGVIFGRVKGGFTVDLSGVVAFLPGSQVDVRPIKDVTTLMGIAQPLQILKMDKKLGNIVVSRRAILEESRSEARDEMLATIKEGVELEGIVKNITDYGAFIDLGSVDGLLHVTDISWSRINHPSEVLTLGQKVNVVVVKFNEETKRISLGMKQLDANPWDGIEKDFPVGKKMTGKVTNITDYGAFIELKDGIEGLVHSSEISWVKNTQHPRRLLSIGQEVEFVILEIDQEKHRISLSIKQCIDNPWTKFADTHKVGDVIKQKVRNVAEFGLFVALDDDIDGMVHESDLAWEERGEEALAKYKKDDEIECKILAIDIEKERISLGVKQLSEQPEGVKSSKFEGFAKNQVVTGVITDVQADGIEVALNDDVNAFIKKMDLSSSKEDQRTNRFNVGDKIDAKIMSMDKNRINLSVRALEMDERKKAIKEFGSTDSGASLGDILGAALNEANTKSSK